MTATMIKDLMLENKRNGKSAFDGISNEELDKLVNEAEASRAVLATQENMRVGLNAFGGATC